MPITFNSIVILVWFVSAIKLSRMGKVAENFDIPLKPIDKLFIAVTVTSLLFGLLATARLVVWMFQGFNSPELSTLVIFTAIMVYYTIACLKYCAIGKVYYTLPVAYGAISIGSIYAIFTRLL